MKKQIDIAPFDQLFEMLGRARVHHSWSRHNQNFPASLRARFNSRAIPRITALFGFSIETLLAMNSKTSVRDVERCSGTTRMP